MRVRCGAICLIALFAALPIQERSARRTTRARGPEHEIANRSIMECAVRWRTRTYRELFFFCETVGMPSYTSLCMIALPRFAFLKNSLCDCCLWGQFDEWHRFLWGFSLSLIDRIRGRIVFSLTPAPAPLCGRKRWRWGGGGQGRGSGQRHALPFLQSISSMSSRVEYS